MKKNLVRILQFQYGRKLKVTTLKIHNLNSCPYTLNSVCHDSVFCMHIALLLQC